MKRSIAFLIVFALLLSLTPVSVVIAQDPEEGAVETPIEAPVEEPVAEPAEEPIEEPVEEAVEAPIEEPIEEPVGEAVEEPATTDDSVEQPIEDPIEEPAEETAIGEPAAVPAVAPAEGVSSAAVGTMNTAFAVQNMSTTAQANVSVEFRNEAGTLKNTLSQLIAAGANFNFDQRYDSGKPDPTGASFAGSAMVSSDQPVGAAANMVRTGGTVNSYESYNSVAQASVGPILLPQILARVDSGGLQYNTTISIQNTDTVNAASVQVAFAPAAGSGNGTAYVLNVSIPAGGTSYIDQATTPTSAQIGSRFFGSATVTSNRAVVAVVYSDGGGQLLLAYPSYTAGTSDEIALPSIYKKIASQGDSYSTAILIVNFDKINDATVEITYIPDSASYTVSGTDTVTVPAGGALNVDQRYNAPSITSATFMGSATVDCTGSQNIAAMVNLRGGSRFAMTYGGVMGGGGITAYLPISYKNISSGGYDWSSAVLVQNTGGTNANVTFTFYPQGGSAITDGTAYPVNAGESAQFDLRYDTAIASHATFIGAVKVTSTAAVGVMVQTRGSGGTGDSLMAFQGLMP